MCYIPVSGVSDKEKHVIGNRGYTEGFESIDEALWGMQYTKALGVCFT